MTLLLFALLALVALVGAIGVIISRNAVHSALFLLLNFAVFAVMYILLGAQFLGLVQVTVYAGAIVVLFLFVVMLIGADIGDIRSGLRQTMRWLALFLVALFLLAMLLGVARNLPPDTPIAGAPQDGSVQAVGQALYTTYLLPFELASLLLLAGMLGGVVLARRFRKND
ncbi:MAG: NADH-quinone oxidoreductase subunit J [Caldilineales bacterium]|nr:NADH-quinone oxidoreductase subunit J [Caldilineales bacterium]MCW5856861.1 NADH-quinone oxidoreductase subunit J [Caldilineales bacterium]